MVEVVVVVEEGVENRSFAPRVLPPRGNTATAWLDKDKRKEEREMTKNLTNRVLT